MTDAEFAASNKGAFTTLAGSSSAEESAEIATGFIGHLRTSQQPGLDDDQIAAPDERILQAMTDLGISEQCTGGVQG